MSRPHTLALLLLAALAAGCSQGETEHDDAPRPVLVTQPESAASLLDVFPGEVRARHEPELSFRIGGKISRRQVSVGDRVEKGDTLAELNAEDVRLEQQAARARLASAQADQRLAQSELERYRTLRDRQVVSRSEFDNVESRAQASTAQLEQAQAQLDVARNQAGYAVLEAPEDGVIAQRLAEAGQVVAAGQAVFVLAVEGEREIVINLPEQDSKRLQVGDQVSAELWSRQGEAFPGRVRELSPAADPTTRTFQARVAFDNRDVDADLGQSARVFINGDADADALSVPLSALTAEGEERYLWVVDEAHTLVKTPVKVGAYQEDRVPVLDGLARDAWVVAAGTQLLREGETVRPLDRRNRDVEAAGGEPDDAL